MIDPTQFLSIEKLRQMGADDVMRSGRNGTPKYPNNEAYMQGWNAQLNDLRRPTHG